MKHNTVVKAYIFGNVLKGCNKYLADDFYRSAEVCSEHTLV